MASTKSRLGRGLSALLQEANAQNFDHHPPDQETLRQLSVTTITTGKYQPRTHIDQEALQELAASIKAQGLVQPILVRQIGEDKYELIAGERRWRAAQLAGLNQVPAVVRRVSDKNAMAVALIENIQRENLNPLEEAAGLQRLLEEFSLTHQQIADSIGRSRAAVSNILRLLHLNPSVREQLAKGQLEMGHARALLALPNDTQPDAAKVVIQQGLSVRQTEQLVRNMLTPRRITPSSPAPKDPDISRLEDKLSAQLAAKVRIKHRRKGGQIVIDYHSLDELDGIISKLD